MTTAEDVRRACENYNQAPGSHDAQQALKHAIGATRCVYLSEKSIDIDQTVKVWTFCARTGQGGRDGAKTVDEVLAAPMEACPISGEALLDGETAQGVNWSPISQGWREVVAYAVERGERIGTAEQVVYQLQQSTSAPPWPRLQRELADLRAKAVRTASEDALLLRVTRRLVWQKPTYEQLIMPQLVETHGPLTGAAVRRLMGERLRTVSDLDSWACDHFPHVHSRFSGGMDRLSRETLLMQVVPLETLVQKLP